MSAHPHRAAAAAGTLLAIACATGAPPPPGPPSPRRPPIGAMEVEKTRQKLEIAPLELVFSGVRGQPPVEEAVAIRNTGDQSLPVKAMNLIGPQVSSFSFTSVPPLPMAVPPRGQAVVTVAFAPPPDSAPGVHRATLRIQIGPADEDAPPVDLSALVLTGAAAADEPPLAQIAEALGFALDAGSGGRQLGMEATPVGEEMVGVRFQRATASAVAVYPVARFSGGGGAVSYGYYRGEAPSLELQPLAVIPDAQQQTLNPELEPDARTTFDPGEGAFGLYLQVPPGVRLHTDRALNPGRGGSHAARVFPLTSREGGRIKDACLVAFELAADGDYQDVVFVMWNVKTVR